jgi:hypothetical protein
MSRSARRCWEFHELYTDRRREPTSLQHKAGSKSATVKLTGVAAKRNSSPVHPRRQRSNISPASAHVASFGDSPADSWLTGRHAGPPAYAVDPRRCQRNLRQLRY